MAYRDQLIITAAPSGTGKTYVRGVCYIVKVFLPDESGVLYSNYPHDIPAIQEHFKGKIEPEEIERRLQRIPRDVLDSWMNDGCGPWDYFAGKDVKGAHIAIDEVHNYLHKKSSASHVQLWKKFLGEIRKRGATIELLTQAQNKLPSDLLTEAALLIRLVDSQSLQDPLFKIELADWYEMLACYTGIYPAAVWEIREHLVGTKHEEISRRKWRRDKYYFKLYNSYNDTEDGEQGIGEPPPKMYQKLNFIALHWWFLKKNFESVLPRVLGVAFAFWLVSGGFVMVMNYFMGRMMDTAKITAKSKVGKTLGVDSQTLEPDDENLGEWVTIKQRKELQDQLAMEKRRSESLQKFRDQVNQNINEMKRRGDRIGMLFRDYAVTESGRMVRKGDDIYTYMGLKIIDRINKDEGNVYFTDGGLYHVGQHTRRLSNKIEALTSPTLQTVLDGAGGGSQGTGRKRLTEAERKQRIKFQGRRPTTLYTPASDFEKLRENNRRRSGSHESAGHSGSHRPVPDVNALNGGSSSRR